MTVLFRALVMLSVASTSLADPITLPNSFTPGTRALATEVNENFTTLVTESNAQDLRITAVADINDAQDQQVLTLTGRVDQQDQQVTVLAQRADLLDQSSMALMAEVGVQGQDIAAITTDIDAQDQRISVLESTIVSDQLFCVTAINWPVSDAAFPCRQSSDPNTIRNLTFVQVLAEGWVGVSAGGDFNNRMVYIFSQ
ncbi:MAG: hypothetical protein AAF545_11300 [Pseudomonadota bacterium]